MHSNRKWLPKIPGKILVVIIILTLFACSVFGWLLYCMINHL
jgi:hypothetical protein